MFGKRRNEVLEIPLEMIHPNPYQPRKDFPGETLEELAQSIKIYGVIQPIIVRNKNKGGYELIAGERRWRAAQIAGLKKIPAIVKHTQDEDSVVIALVENLQREDLNFLDEAQGYYQLISEYDLTQEELAEKVGKSQSTIANKLRILKLPESVKGIISREKLTERHARCLLKLPSEELQIGAVHTIVQKKLNVKEAEKLVEKILDEERKSKSPARKIKKFYRDIRLFENPIKELISNMKESGINVIYMKEDKGDYFEFVIKIPKR
jgi:ParB family chromosome partitioning protein